MTTTRKAAHTPIPWKAELTETSPVKILSPDGDNIVAYSIYGPRSNVDDYASGVQVAQANAEFIVRACNCHDELLAALKDCLAQVTGPAMVYGNGCGNDGKKTGLSHHEFNALRNDRIAKARAAIAKAEGTNGAKAIRWCDMSAEDQEAFIEYRKQIEGTHHAD